MWNQSSYAQASQVQSPAALQSAFRAASNRGDPRVPHPLPNAPLHVCIFYHGLSSRASAAPAGKRHSIFTSSQPGPTSPLRYPLHLETLHPWKTSHSNTYVLSACATPGHFQSWDIEVNRAEALPREGSMPVGRNHEDTLSCVPVLIILRKMAL